MRDNKRFILPNKSEAGFTFVEIMIVVTVVAILIAIGIMSFNGSTRRAKNAERKNDITIIYNELERSYRAQSAVAEPSYPATTADIGEYVAKLTENNDVVTAPGANSNSVIPAVNADRQVPEPNQYIYQSFKSDGTLCSNRPCTRYVLYYNYEEDDDNSPGRVVEVHSMRQQ